MPYVPHREKEDFSRVDYSPMWLLPCRVCGKEFKITSGQILGFADICPECVEREEQGLPQLRRGADPRKVLLALGGIALLAAAGLGVFVWWLLAA